MTTCLGKSCSFGLPRVPFVNCCQFMYLVISLLVLRVGCGIWLYQFLIIAYLVTCHYQAQFWELCWPLILKSILYFTACACTQQKWLPITLRQKVGRVKRICVFEHSVMTNFNCACPAIQRGEGFGFLSEGPSWLTAWRGPNNSERFENDGAYHKIRGSVKK